MAVRDVFASVTPACFKKTKKSDEVLRCFMVIQFFPHAIETRSLNNNKKEDLIERLCLRKMMTDERGRFKSN